MNKIELTVTDADGLAANVEPAIIILVITRAEIEAGYYGSVLERLHVLTDNAESVLRYQESLVFEVRGYDSDPRELCEIAQVRGYFAGLTAQWPHWLWFLHRGSGSIALLLTLLCKVCVLRSNPKKFGIEFTDLKQLERTLHDLFGRGNVLLDSYGVDERLIAESAGSLEAELFLG